MFDKDEFNRFIIDNEIVEIYSKPQELNHDVKSHVYFNWGKISDSVNLIDKLTDYLLEFVEQKELDPDCILGVREHSTKLGLIAQYKWAFTHMKYPKKEFFLPMGRGTPKKQGHVRNRSTYLGKPGGRTVIVGDVAMIGSALLDEIGRASGVGAQVVAAISLTDRLGVRSDGTLEEAINAKGVLYYTMSYAPQLIERVYDVKAHGEHVGRAIEEEFSHVDLRLIK